MDTYNFFFFFSASITFILVVLPVAYSHETDQFMECNGTFNCGTIQGIRYPFWGNGRPRYCGHRGFELLCHENQFPAIDINSQRFRVLNISRTGTMTIAPVDIWDDPCPQQLYNISLDHTLFDFASSIRDLDIFYGCPLEDDIPSQNRFVCNTSNGDNYAYYLDESLSRIHRSELEGCGVRIMVPVSRSGFDELWSGIDKIADAWNKGFDVVYVKEMVPCMACRNSGGVCGSNDTSLNFLCFCPDKPYSKSCIVPGMFSSSLNIFLSNCLTACFMV
ncbi:hypothetical protein F3Y22_tig00112382pilonHSYRG00011 [Hibiscus syriacus]|uniref:non-specific serine/threonine protein kinase n=1 Tax=Hibiscus syriacus TaxID=106335 RepID=A0A6A2YAM2_HIBSY|nr:LEAF RUST 10 DISEASE-RESISTANCE LOCUS RECEPTOR-LIKE PROTEIN KINASE-like 2.5 [Hibiscus syriacus]KAE8667754.1 hypothetical protein F3Y22_tig00112382pilonHSYRG00011 [Hibiscus syriacus]